MKTKVEFLPLTEEERAEAMAKLKEITEGREKISGVIDSMLTTNGVALLLCSGVDPDLILDLFSEKLSNALSGNERIGE